MKWKNLSKGEIREILIEVGPPVSMYKFAKEIQKKLKEINYGQNGVCNCNGNHAANHQTSVRCSDE